MKTKKTRSYKALFSPKEDRPLAVLIKGEVLKYFIIKGTNGLPAQIHVAVFKDGIKQRGHKLIPNTLTDKTFCFDSLNQMDKYVCPCNKPDCKYSSYLKQCVANFRKQIVRI